MRPVSDPYTLKRTPRRARVGVVTGWLLAVAVLALIGTVYLAQASQAAQEGVGVETLKLRLQELQRENTQLEAAIAEAQKPDVLARRAAELGYRPATGEELEYLPVNDFPTPEPTPTATALPAQSRYFDPAGAAGLAAALPGEGPSAVRVTVWTGGGR